MNLTVPLPFCLRLCLNEAAPSFYSYARPLSDGALDRLLPHDMYKLHNRKNDQKARRPIFLCKWYILQHVAKNFLQSSVKCDIILIGM